MGGNGGGTMGKLEAIVDNWLASPPPIHHVPLCWFLSCTPFDALPPDPMIPTIGRAVEVAFSPSESRYCSRSVFFAVFTGSFILARSVDFLPLQPLETVPK